MFHQPPTETPIKPEAQPSSPPIQSTPLDGIDTGPHTHAQSTEAPSRAEGLQRPTLLKKTHPNNSDHSPQLQWGMVLIFLQTTPERRFRSQTDGGSIDDRLSEAKANLGTILEHW